MFTETERLLTDIQTYTKILGRLEPEQEIVLWNVAELFKQVYEKTESVPEFQFASSLTELLLQNDIKMEAGWMDKYDLEEMKVSKEDGFTGLEFFVNPRELFAEQKIRPDVVFRKDYKDMLVFEIDSFQYHSSQKALMHDKKRERKIAALGVPVYRFAAKEILNDPWGTAIEASKILEKHKFISFKKQNGKK